MIAILYNDFLSVFFDVTNSYYSLCAFHFIDLKTNSQVNEKENDLFKLKFFISKQCFIRYYSLLNNIKALKNFVLRLLQ